jgi:phenylacetate-coenzyme A ligase PaaK-like adenylate-forming protein
MKQEYLNERMETMSQGELRELQEHKFLKQLDYVWRGSAFY